MRQGYIGRNFEPAYFASRRPASYFLAPDGVQALRATADPQYHHGVRHVVQCGNALQLPEWALG